MDRICFKENEQISLNSEQQDNCSLCGCVNDKSTLIIKVEGEKAMNLNIDIQVGKDASLTLLLIHNNHALLNLNDHYILQQGSENTIAYCCLNPQPLTTHSNYELNGHHASLHVLSASLSSEEKQFNQDILHLANDTFAQVDNFGVVLKNGSTSLVVRNRIEKGKDNCETHQSSRLLTTDENAKAKVLPILFIDDNEVAASHACSLGQPDGEQIYYLMSRGLSRAEALQLITIGYLMPITKIVLDEDINNILKEEIENKVIIHA